MIYGTHNSLSAYKPLKWYKRFLNFTSKCQSKTISEQLKLGTIFFDIRLRIHNSELYGAHGLIEYNITFKQFLDELKGNISKLNITDNIYFRVIREDTFGDNNESLESFIKIVNDIFNEYKIEIPNVKLVSIYSKEKWQGEIYENINYLGSTMLENTKTGFGIKGLEIGEMVNKEKEICVGEMYFSKGLKWLFGLPIPKISAKKLRPIIDKKQFSGINFIDFL